MKKVLSVLSLLFVLVVLSCDYDDSNDIDILKPIDSTTTGITTPDLPN